MANGIFVCDPRFLEDAADSNGKSGAHGSNSGELPPLDGDVLPPTGELAGDKHLLADPGFLNLLIAKTPIVLSAGELGEEVALELDEPNVAPYLCPVDDPQVLIHANGLARTYRPNDITAFLGKRDLPRLADFFRAQAPYMGRRQTVARRLAWLPHDRAIWITLSRPDGACIRITASHWNLEMPDKPLFLRNRHQRPLPEPVSSPDGYDALVRILPPMPDADCKLLIGALLGMMIPSAMHPTFSYPVLVLTGQPGSGKSYLTRLIKNLLDAEHAPIATRPTKAEDVWVQARYSHILAYDNMRPVWDGLSDTLCALTTNSSQKRRTLYSDHGLSVNAAHGAVILNGISTDLARQRDLLDRAITINLQRFDSFNPDAGDTLDRDMPFALGYLCDLMVRVLANFNDTPIETTSRLALVAKVGAAAEPFGCATPFAHLLVRNQRDALLATCAHHPVLDALYDLMGSQPSWYGTYKELLAQLELRTDLALTKIPEWPRSGQGMGRFMRDNASLIRELDIAVVEGPRRRNGQTLTVRRLPAFTYEVDK